MKKIIVILALFFVTLFGDDLALAKNFKEAQLLAKQSEKPIMMIISRHTCRYCILLERETLSDAQVIGKLNKDFITYIAYTDDNDYFPDEFYRPGTPAIWFLDNNAQAMSEPIMGAVDAKNLLKVLDIVTQRFEKVKKMQKYSYTKSKL